MNVLLPYSRQTDRNLADKECAHRGADQGRSGRTDIFCKGRTKADRDVLTYFARGGPRQIGRYWHVLWGVPWGRSGGTDMFCEGQNGADREVPACFVRGRMGQIGRYRHVLWGAEWGRSGGTGMFCEGQNGADREVPACFVQSIELASKKKEEDKPASRGRHLASDSGPRETFGRKPEATQSNGMRTAHRLRMRPIYKFF